MMLILTLLVPVSCLAYTTSLDAVPLLDTTPNVNQDCLIDLKCPMIEAPLCVTVRRSNNQQPLHMMLLNQCEMEYLKCYPNYTTTVVPMKACHFGNATNTSKNDGAKKRKKRGAKNDDEFSIIQFSPKGLQNDDLKSFVEWSGSSLENIETKVYFGFVLDNTQRRGDKILLEFRKTMIAAVKMVSADDTKRIKDMYITECRGIEMSRAENMDEFIDIIENGYNGVPEVPDEIGCSQEIYLSTIKALRKSVHGTHMYVFSNGPPTEDDAHFEFEVRRVGQEKQIEVSFVVAGECSRMASKKDPFYQHFYSVAAETKGQVLRFEEETFEKEFLTYVNHTVDFDRRVVVSSVYPAEGSNKLRIPFEITEKDDFTTVTVSGDNCDFVVFNQRNNTMDYAYSMISKHVKMYKYIGLKPGMYRIRVHSNDQVSQNKDLSAPVLVSVAVSSVEMHFKYGFSEKETKTLKNTEAQPKFDTNLYIIIAVREPKYWVEVTYAAILQMDDTVISTYILVKTTLGDVYRTKYQVMIPNLSQMKIKVVGYLRDELGNKTVERTSTRIIRPQKPKNSILTTTTKHVKTTTLTPDDKKNTRRSRTTTRKSRTRSTTEPDSSILDDYTDDDTTTTRRSRRTTRKPRTRSTTEPDNSILDDYSDDDTTTTRRARTTTRKPRTSNTPEPDTSSDDDSANGDDDKKSTRRSRTTTRKHDIKTTRRSRRTTRKHHRSKYISHVKPTDQCIFTCDLEHVPLLHVSTYIRDELKAKNADDNAATTIGVPPKIKKELDPPAPCRSGHEHYFICTLKCNIIEGEPHPKIEWTVIPPASEDEYSDNEDTNMHEESLTWIIRNPAGSVTDDRYFVCRAYNDFGEDKFTVRSRHHLSYWDTFNAEIVDIDSIPSQHCATEGDDVKMNCRFTQEKRIKWSYKRARDCCFRPLAETGNTLILHSVRIKNEGFYRCEPANPSIHDKQDFELYVRNCGGSDYDDYAKKDVVYQKLKEFAAHHPATNWTKAELQQFSSCPSQCPARDVLVCARCQHGVHRIFLSDCHMRMYQCKYPEDRLELVARRPCAASAPILGEMPRPITHEA